MPYAVTNPATGEVVKTYETITDEGLQAAIASATEAHRTWSKNSTVAERATLQGSRRRMRPSIASSAST